MNLNLDTRLQALIPAKVKMKTFMGTDPAPLLDNVS